MRLARKFPYLVEALCLLTTIVGITLSQAQADTANLNLTLTIITPPACTLNGRSVMNVSFGDVQQGLIDGTYKRMPINYGLVCNSLAKNALKMTLGWTNVSLGGGDAIQTNRSNLGIAIYKGSTRLNNSTSLSFTYGSPPSLYAVPVKPSGKMLTDGGSFSGTMTITLDYQ